MVEIGSTKGLCLVNSELLATAAARPAARERERAISGPSTARLY